MATTPLTNTLTPAIREKLYLAYTLIGVALGAIQVAFITGDSGQPEWLTVTLGVFAFVGGALGLTAASNVNAGGSPPNGV